MKSGLLCPSEHPSRYGRREYNAAQSAGIQLKRLSLIESSSSLGYRKLIHA